ncbi:dihydropteroate synthase [Luteolibacter sp. LG18]|uniref:dihydropteroate synthase n=1 Tax=Luteolibacter sp. LG18 TaxID=2819286 RepID=UPI002B312731|nr:dihydropteroate synthase [Luteolibacter sp. LG18]
MLWRLRDREIHFPRRPLVMGIVNINDDSFCADGTLDPAAALEIARQQLAEGADIIDAGAESARTNRAAISVDEEIARLRSFLAGWPDLVARSQPRDSIQLWPPVLSINTWRPEVVAAIVTDPAVALVNDMGGLPDDRNARLCAAAGVALLVMHSVGEPKVPHFHQQWDDVMGSLAAFFVEKIALCEAAGLSRERLILDPGIDFAKQKDDNLMIYQQLDQLQRFGCPVLVPVSRKTVIGETLGIPEPARRDAGTVACISAAMRRGAQVFRVHNVPAAWQAAGVLFALK